MEDERLTGPLFLSVVMPVLNEGKHIAGVIEALVKQDYPAERFEILVVDGGSTDDTVSVVARFGNAHDNVRVLKNPGRLSSSGRNIGARASRGDAVLFIDGHCEVPDQFLLRNLNSLFQRTSADIICRPQPLEVAGMDAAQKAIAVARASWLGHNPSSFIFSTREEGFVSPESSGAAYSRSVFERIGYFDESFDACEDVDFNLRAAVAGFKAFTSPSVTVRYSPRDSVGSLFRQMLRYGKGRGRLFMKHRRDALLSAVLLGLPPILFAGLAVLAFFSHVARILLLTGVVAYISLVVGVSIALSLKQELANLPVLVFAFVATHAGLFAGFWRGLFSAHRKVSSTRRPGE